MSPKLIALILNANVGALYIAIIWIGVLTLATAICCVDLCKHDKQVIARAAITIRATWPTATTATTARQSAPVLRANARPLIAASANHRSIGTQTAFSTKATTKYEAAKTPVTALSTSPEQ